jgi:hypothetical protein
MRCWVRENVAYRSFLVLSCNQRQFTVFLLFHTFGRLIKSIFLIDAGLFDRYSTNSEIKENQVVFLYWVLPFQNDVKVLATRFLSIEDFADNNLNPFVSLALLSIIQEARSPLFQKRIFAMKEYCTPSMRRMPPSPCRTSSLLALRVEKI